MSRNNFCLTIINQIFCWSLIVWLMSAASVEAQGQGAFLGPIYYGPAAVSAVFDHDLPIPGDNDTDGNESVRHNDGSLHEPDPITGDIPDDFGYDQHSGIDYAISHKPVLVAADGTVITAEWFDPTNHENGFGLYVEIDHGNGYETLYGHLSTIIVEVGETVVADPEDMRGVIGISGQTGNSTGPHLHFGVYQNGVVVNPYGWQDTQNADPWETDSGVASVNLWRVGGRPAVNTPQYLGDDPIPAPDPAEEYYFEFVIDDDNGTGPPFFTTSGGCWTPNGPAGYNNSHQNESTQNCPKCVFPR